MPTMIMYLVTDARAMTSHRPGRVHTVHNPKKLKGLRGTREATSAAVLMTAARIRPATTRRRAVVVRFIMALRFPPTVSRTALDDKPSLICRFAIR